MSPLAAFYLCVVAASLLWWLFRRLSWPIARWILVPLGWVRGAHALAMHAGPLAADPVGGAVFMGAWAHRRRRRIADRTWLDSKLAAAMPLGGAGIAASGLLAAAQGDAVQARAWLRSLDWVHPKVLPDICRRVGREWLAAEAASRGDWDAVLVAVCAPGPRTRATRLLAAIALQMTRGSLENPRVSGLARFHLWLLWFLAPRRRALRPLVEQALGPLPMPPPAEAEAPDAEGPYRSPQAPTLDALQLALAAQARLVTTPSSERLGEAIAAWERALPGLPSALAEGVRDDLAAVAAAARLPVPEGPGLADELRRELRRDLLEELETISAALESRVSAGRVHDAFAEWSTFLELRRRYDEAGSLAGREAQRLVYARVHDALCPLAVVLWNQRKEHPLANAMFRWLLDEARLTEHATLIPHEEKNVGCRF